MSYYLSILAFFLIIGVYLYVLVKGKKKSEIKKEKIIEIFKKNQRCSYDVFKTQALEIGLKKNFEDAWQKYCFLWNKDLAIKWGIVSVSLIVLYIILLYVFNPISYYFDFYVIQFIIVVSYPFIIFYFYKINQRRIFRRKNNYLKEFIYAPFYPLIFFLFSLKGLFDGTFVVFSMLIIFIITLSPFILLIILILLKIKK